MNKELLEKLDHMGIKTEHYRHVDIFNEYNERITNGEKTSYVVAVLSDKFGLGERTIYRIVKQMQAEFKMSGLHSIDSNKHRQG